MQELPYSSWALVHVDDAPTSTEATSTMPPLMSNIAVDSGSSLVFELRESFSGLAIRVVTTALSAEGRDDPGRVFVGEGPTPLRELQVDEWVKTVDGLDALFAARVSGNGRDRYVKLFFEGASTLIVSSLSFEV